MSTYSNSNAFFASSIPMNSYRRVMNEIHVLFVDHDQFNYFNTKGLLEICDYRVTHVQAAAEAIFMLSNELNFDLVLANINSPDAQGFKLLHAAVEMEIPIILMSIQDDTVSAMKAIEIGALLFIKTPTTLEMLRCLWQHVARERARAARERERLLASYVMPRGTEFGEMAPHNPHENPSDLAGGNSLFMMKERGQLRRSYYKRKRVEEDYDSESELNSNSHGKVKRKICTEWTQELHEKFIEAVKQLGEGRCFPKEILELMNVPGLTRMQVASHLQKCRNENWRSPGERKYSTLGMHPMSSDINGGSRLKQRRFGSMPRIFKALSDHEAYGQASRGEHGPISYNESEIETQNTMINETSSMANQITYYQDYGALVPHDNNNVPFMNSSNLRHLPLVDGFFTSDTDCMIPNFPNLPQGFEDMNHPQSSSRAFLSFDSTVYVHDQTNSKEASMDSTSQWTGSENSNFCSGDSQTNQNS